MAGDDKKKKKWTEGREFTRTQNDGYDTYTPKGDHTEFNILGVGDKRKIAPLGMNLEGQDVNALPDLDHHNYDANLAALADLNDKVDHQKYIERTSLFEPFGATKDIALNQGWYPESSSSDHTIFLNKYNGPFNDVIIPGEEKKGSIALIGKKGNKFDIIIRKNNGDIKDYIHKNVSPEDVQDYIQNNQSTIQQRIDKIQKPQ